MICQAQNIVKCDMILIVRDVSILKSVAVPCSLYHKLRTEPRVVGLYKVACKP